MGNALTYADTYGQSGGSLHVWVLSHVHMDTIRMGRYQCSSVDFIVFRDPGWHVDLERDV